ncbi:transposase family Tnp2 protein [Salix suchowensis]|nr:transposase family Tnp2 protein [Salix suchowensis]
MAPHTTKSSSRSTAGRRVTCGCGCGDLVHPRTERNHLQGKALPHVRASATQTNSEVLGLAHELPSTSATCTKHRRGPNDPLQSSLHLAKRRKDLGIEARIHSDEVEHEQDHCTADHLQLGNGSPHHVDMEGSQLAAIQDHCDTDLHQAQSVHFPDELEDEDTLTTTLGNAAAMFGNVTRRVTVEDASDEEDGDKEDDDMENENGGFDDPTEEEPTDDEDEEDSEDGLDIIDERFEQELADFVEELTDEELLLLRLFALKTEEGLTDRAYDRLKLVFPEVDIPSFKVVASRVAFLAEFKPVPYDCCINSCCCYVASYAKLTACPFCNEARYTADKHHESISTIFPLFLASKLSIGTPRLQQRCAIDMTMHLTRQWSTMSWMATIINASASLSLRLMGKRGLARHSVGHVN